LRSVSWFAVVAFAGWAGCSFNSTASGTGGNRDASVPVVDGPVAPPIDAPPGVTCYGPAGWQACFATLPAGNVMLKATINTDGGAPCGATPTGWAASQPAACFITGDTITVPGAGTVATGHKPLVLVAKSLITVTGELDVVAKGAPPTECQAFSKNPNPAAGGNVGGGGGAGGSFMTQAGNGGNGNGGSQNGQAGPVDPAAPGYLRGGCPGQAGGAQNPPEAGDAGLGGSSVYLLSGGEIMIQGAINASGSGGGGGDKRAGGGGGGSGGVIVLFAATITIPAAPAPAPVLIANGGGGGGGSTGGKALAGGDPSVTSATAPTPGMGNGGNGYPATANALDGTSGAATGDGGGGGGGAAGYIQSNKPLPGATVSPSVVIFP
jgi:hypothetical protein